MLGIELRQRGRFSPSRLFRAGEAGAWYDPSDLASMAQDSAGTMAASVGQPVGMLRDKSGRGNHAVQASANARPVLRQDGGGRLYLEFDGVDDFLRAAFTCPQPWDRVAAIRQLSWTNIDRVFGAAGAGHYGALVQEGASPELRLYDGAAGGAAANAGLAVGVTNVVTERHHDAGSRLAIGRGAYTAGTSGALLPGGVTIAGSAPGYHGHIRLYGLVMIARALSDAETARLRRYMAARAGVVL